MTDWTVGKVLFAGAGAAGVAFLVSKAVRSFRSEARTPSLPPPPPPRPTTQAPRRPMPPGWEPGPATDPAPAPPPRPRPRPPTGRFSPLVERWRPEVEQRAGDLPVDPILKWIEMESGGDMDSRGMAGREIGIFQLDYPGDGKRYGGSFAQLEDIARRSNERENPFDLSWLTAEELDAEVGAGIRMMHGARKTVREVLAKNGIAWPESSFDFGTAIKQIHATPAVITQLIPKITKRDGKPPADWNELHRLVNEFPVDQMDGLDKLGRPYGLRLLALSPSKHGLKNRLEDTLRNAEIFGHAWARAFA